MVDLPLRENRTKKSVQKEKKQPPIDTAKKNES